VHQRAVQRIDLYSESAFSKNTDVVPSTKKTERRGAMVGVVKPSGYKVKLQDVVRPPDIKIVKPVNSSSDIDSLLIHAKEKWMTLRNRNVLRLQTIQTTSLTRWL
jgi:hypothetical protein